MEESKSDNIKHTLTDAVAPVGKKGGRPKLPSQLLKKKRGFRLSDDVYNRVKSLAALGKKSPSQIISDSIKEAQIRQVPSVQNMKAWSELSRVTANLNQIAFRLNYISKGEKEERSVTYNELRDCIEDVKKEVVALRAEIGDSA